VPRCRLLPSEADLPIDRQIRSLLAKHTVGTVYLIGPPGCGKSVALAHLAQTVGADSPLVLLDDSDPVPDSPHGAPLAIRTLQRPFYNGPSPALLMSPWTDDDLIEYLLSTHPGRCRAVMGKIQSLPGRDTLNGLPELWRIVLDEMAADDRVVDIESAFIRFLTRELNDPDARLLAERLCLWQLAPWADKAPVERCEGRIARIIRHSPMKIMLAARGLVHRLCECVVHDELKGALSPELIEHAGRLLAGAPEAIEMLERMVNWPDDSVHAMAASLLHAAGTGWRPSSLLVPALPRLSGARLAGARWSGAELAGVQLDGAHLENADLYHAHLPGANLSRAKLASACFRRAGLRGARLTHADLRRADFTDALADETDFTGVVLAHALLNDASLKLALFRAARLDNAMFSGANLKEADFTNATITDACFAGADLSGATLTWLPLKRADLRSAVLKMANLAHCDMEELEASSVDFGAACLTNALLTGSILRGCSFRNATLRGCGLAEIDWEGADLRDADLRGSTFHMGSTRSGLVNSDIPCEGSRTGFYTDDYFDRDYKDPRDIRKANLRNADLRGAKIDGVDFYLVDLRGARYTNSQAEWFVRCGAILCLG